MSTGPGTKFWIWRGCGADALAALMTVARENPYAGDRVGVAPERAADDPPAPPAASADDRPSAVGE